MSINLRIIIGAVITFGGVSGVIIIGKVADLIGKRKCLILLCLPNLTFYVLIYFATSVNQLYAARAIAGFTGGGLFRIIPLFIGEIAESNVRGKLGAYFPLGMNLGIFLIYVLGTYVDYHTIPFVMIPFFICYVVSMLFIPDTPQFLITKHQNADALQSLKFYRNCNEHNFHSVNVVREELESLKENILNHHKMDLKWKDFSKLLFSIY